MQLDEAMSEDQGSREPGKTPKAMKRDRRNANKKKKNIPKAASTDSQTRERDQEDDRCSHKKLKALPTRTRGAPVHSGSLAHLM